MKIAIIGNAGSGKSTLAKELHEQLKIPLYHLDQYFWKPDWVEPNRSDFEKIHNAICDKDAWIIEGIAIRFFDYRAKKADIIVFLDIPLYMSLYRVFYRTYRYWNIVRPCGASECPERFPTNKFLFFMINFNKVRKPDIEAVIDKYKNTKEIFVIKTKKELQNIHCFFKKR